MVVNCVRHFVIIKFFKLYFIMNNRRCYFSHTKWLILHSLRTAIVRNLILINNLLIPTFNKIYKRSMNPCVFFFFSITLSSHSLSSSHSCIPVAYLKWRANNDIEWKFYNNNNNTLCTQNFCWIIVLFTPYSSFLSKKCAVIILSQIDIHFESIHFRTIEVTGSFIVAFYSLHIIILSDKTNI